MAGARLAFAVRAVPDLRQHTETSINGMVEALERPDASELMVVTVTCLAGGLD